MTKNTDKPEARIDGLKVLIIESNHAFAQILADIVTSCGGKALALDSFDAGARHFSHYHPDIAICSRDLADGSGLKLLAEWKSENPSIPIMLTVDEENLESTLAALRAGAFDVLCKTCPSDLITTAFKRAGEIFHLREKIDLAHSQEPTVAASTIIGTSRVALSLIASINKIAKSKCDSCMILGESGVGKELAAHQLHDFSSRAKEPFIEINAASIPETLLESELFGHERGAYTDAKDRKAGLFEIAGAGTIFLDEIGELPLNLQAKLLRVLESRRFKRLGGVKDIDVKARVIVATNRNLGAHVMAGRFRADLYYRLNVIPIRIPALRERKADIAELTAYFAATLSQQLSVPAPLIPQETVAFLEDHSWPGNIRELKNAIYRSLVMFEPEILLPKHIFIENLSELPLQSAPVSIKGTSAGAGKPAKPKKTGEHIIELPAEGIPLEQVEESLILQALERCRHNQTKAATMLGISRHALRYRLEKHGLA